MVEVLKTSVFDAWLSALKDRQAVARITARIDRLALGNPRATSNRSALA